MSGVARWVTYHHGLVGSLRLSYSGKPEARRRLKARAVAAHATQIRLKREAMEREEHRR